MKWNWYWGDVELFIDFAKSFLEIGIEMISCIKKLCSQTSCEIQFCFILDELIMLMFRNLLKQFFKEGH